MNKPEMEALGVIADVFQIDKEKVENIGLVKKGMTNRSSYFSVNGKRYIMRIPGEGTERLINREQEATVFKTIHRRMLCDDPVYIDPQKGHKITIFLDNIRVCDKNSVSDLIRCMEKLREFHEMKLSVPHKFGMS